MEDIYYYCALCDWKGTDKDTVLTLDGIMCPECSTEVSTDHQLTDDINKENRKDA